MTRRRFIGFFLLGGALGLFLKKGAKKDGLKRASFWKRTDVS